jgi:hypothetical protein
MDIEETPIPTMVPPQLSQLLDESGPSNSPEFYCEVFMGTPLSQPTPTGPVPTQIKNPDGTVTTQMPTMDTLAGRADIPPLPCIFPPGKKLAKKGTLTEATELFVFDILNVF